MWYCKYFAIKMMFRCNRNKYSRANDSQEVNKTWLVLLGRVKTMKKSNYLIIFFRTNIRKLLSSFNNWKHRIGCSNSETLFESESLISWKMIGDGQLQNQFSPVQVAHHPINHDVISKFSISWSCLFVTLKRTQRNKMDEDHQWFDLSSDLWPWGGGLEE